MDNSKIKLELSAMYIPRIENGQPFLEFLLQMEEKLSMDTFNFILLKELNNNCSKVMLVLLEQLLSITKLTDQTFSVLLKKKLDNRAQLSILMKFQPHLKDAKSIS